MPLHYKFITTFLEFIPISTKAYSPGTPNVVITATVISCCQAPFMFHTLPFFVGPPINLTCGIFTTGTFLSVSMLSFVNSTTVRWYAPYFTNDECDNKDTYVDALSTLLSLHYSVALLYCEKILYSRIILAGGAILLIGSATICLATCVPCGVHWSLTQRFFQSTEIG